MRRFIQWVAVNFEVGKWEFAIWKFWFTRRPLQTRKKGDDLSKVRRKGSGGITRRTNKEARKASAEQKAPAIDPKPAKRQKARSSFLSVRIPVEDWVIYSNIFANREGAPSVWPLVFIHFYYIYSATFSSVFRFLFPRLFCHNSLKGNSVEKTETRETHSETNVRKLLKNLST